MHNMQPTDGIKHKPQRGNIPGLITSIFIIALLLSACNLPSNNDDSLDSTRASLNVQATLQAQQSEINAQATAIRIAQDVMATVVAQQATQIAQQGADQIQPSPLPPTETSQPTDPLQLKSPPAKSRRPQHLTMKQ